LIGVAIAAVGLLVIRANWIPGDEIIVREYDEHWRPWNRVHGARIRLNLDRLRAYGLTQDDVMEAMTPSTLTALPDPPAGVVFMRRLCRPRQLEDSILKATPEGEILRLKDVAKIEARW
jgi:hypothetical protein